jgi:protocatechuate 3,4-dioxygenase beta subunit
MRRTFLRSLVALAAPMLAGVVQDPPQAKDAVDPPAVLRVIDAETGAALPGAAVQFQYCNDKGCALATVYADDEGVARFPLSKDYHIGSVSAKADGRMAMMMRVTDDKAGDDARPNLELALIRGTKVGGIIEDPEGRPVEGAAVDLRWHEPYNHTHDPIKLAELARETTPRPTAFHLKATTGADGCWTIDGVPADFEAFTIEVDHAQHVRRRYGGEGEHVAKLRDGTYTITLDPGAALLGRIVGSDGEPIVGATIVYDVRSTTDDAHLLKATTDADGRFTFAPVEEVPKMLQIFAAGFAPQLAEAAPGTTNEIALEPARTLSGRVLDEAGQPVPDATVIVEDPGGYAAFDGRQVATSDDGRFEIDVGSKPVKLTVLKRGLRSVRDRSAQADHDAEIRLRPVLLIEGAVVDAETGEPIPSGRITNGHVAQGHTIWQTSGLKKFEGGRYDYALHDEDNLRLKIEADGYLPFYSDVLDHGGHEPLTLDVKLTPAPDMGYRILLPDGRTAAGAEAAVYGVDTQVMLRNGEFTNQTMARRVLADNEGRIVLPAHEPPFKVLIRHDDGYALLTHEALSKVTDETLRLEPWARIEGRAMIGPSPGAEEPISYRPHFDEPSGVRGRLSASYDVHADENGRFVIDRVFPGRGWLSRIAIERRGSYSSHRPMIQEGIVVAAGETTSADLGGTGRPIYGRVVVPEDLPKWRFGTSYLSIERKPLEVPYPPGADAWDPLVRNQFLRDWLATPEGAAAAAKHELEVHQAGRTFGLVFDENGNFRADDVEPGVYQLSIRLVEDTSGMPSHQPIAQAHLTVTVPPIDGSDRSDEPLDLGEVKVQPVTVSRH